MPLCLFFDHCVPRSVYDAFADDGHAILLLRDHLPTDSPDPVVIAKARELDAILVSLNGDFADIVTYPPAKYGGIVSLQFRNHPETASLVVERLRIYFADHPGPSDYTGKLLLVEAHRIRIRT